MSKMLRIEGFAAVLTFLETPGAYREGDEITLVIRQAGNGIMICDLPKREPQLKVEDLVIPFGETARLEYELVDPDGVMTREAGVRHHESVNADKPQVLAWEGSNFNYSSFKGWVNYTGVMPGETEVLINVARWSKTVKLTVQPPNLPDCVYHSAVTVRAGESVDAGFALTAQKGDQVVVDAVSRDHNTATVSYDGKTLLISGEKEGATEIDLNISGLGGKCQARLIRVNVEANPDYTPPTQPEARQTDELPIVAATTSTSDDGNGAADSQN